MTHDSLADPLDRLTSRSASPPTGLPLISSSPSPRPLSEADLDRQPPEPDGWTPRMVIHHVADSETNSYVRLRRLLAEPAGTTIQGYDEAQWARVLHYDRPVSLSLAVFRAVRDSSAELLDLITPDDLARSGVHSESGPYTLADWLDTYIAHARDHAEQIRAALS